MAEWWELQDGRPTSYPCWWAIEHMGHAAFYLRSLMPGDFAPKSNGPLARHAYDLHGVQMEFFPVICQTCMVMPHPEALIPIERVTGLRGRELFFAQYVFGVKPWPPPTSQSSCWNCCCTYPPANRVIQGRRVCADCEQHIRRSMKLIDSEGVFIEKKVQ